MERALSLHGFVVVGQGGKQDDAELHGIDGPVERSQHAFIIRRQTHLRTIAIG